MHCMNLWPEYSVINIQYLQTLSYEQLTYELCMFYRVPFVVVTAMMAFVNKISLKRRNQFVNNFVENSHQFCYFCDEKQLCINPVSSDTF